MLPGRRVHFSPSTSLQHVRRDLRNLPLDCRKSFTSRTVQQIDVRLSIGSQITLKSAESQPSRDVTPKRLRSSIRQTACTTSTRNSPRTIPHTLKLSSEGEPHPRTAHGRSKSICVHLRTEIQAGSPPSLSPTLIRAKVRARSCTTGFTRTSDLVPMIASSTLPITERNSHSESSFDCSRCRPQKNRVAACPSHPEHKRAPTASHGPLRKLLVQQ